MMLYGRKVQISPATPRLQCSPNFTRLQSTELTRETNAWMAVFFGTTTLIPDGAVWELNRDVLVMTQATFDKVLSATKEKS